MAELAHAYVSLSVSTKGMKGDVQKALKGIEPEAAKTGRSMGDRLSAGLGGALKKSAVGVGVAAGAAITAGLTKGVGRLAAIEGAEAKLRGLGNSASTVSGVMQNALAAVKGTAFGLEEAGTVAAGMVAAGIKPGQELEGVLRTVGDTAAIAGVSMQEMGSIFGKVAATGKLQGDELMQLSDAGIPALSLLSKHLGKTTEEVRKMVSDGKVSFADFEAAMRGGVQGAALEMGNTTVGAFKNMGAAAGRLGATLAGPFFNQAGGAFRGVTELLDSLNAKAGPAMQQVSVWLGRTAESAKRAFTEFRQSEFARTAMADLRGIMSNLASTASQVWPALKQIAGALGEASQALGVSAWEAFVAALNVASGVLQALVGPLNVVADVMEAQPGLVTAAVAAWLAFKTVPMIIGKVGTAVSAVQGKVKAATGVFTGFGQQMQVQTQLAAMSGQSIGKMGAAVAVAQTRISGAMGAIKRSAKGALDAFGGPWGVALGAAAAGVAAMAASAQRGRAATDALSKTVRDGAVAHREFAAAITQSAGAMDEEASAAAAKMAQTVVTSTQSMAANATGAFGVIEGPLHRLRNNYDGLAEAARNYGDGQNAAKAQAGMARLEMQALGDATKAAGVSIDDVGKITMQGGAQFNALKAALHDTGSAGVAVAGRLDAIRAQILETENAVNRVGPGFAAMDSALQTLGDKAATADEKLSAMRSVLESLGLIQTSAAQQTMELSKAVQQVAQAASQSSFAADEMGRSFLNADGTLNTMNTNTHQLADSLSTARDKLIQIGNSGGDVEAAFAQMQPEIEASRAAFEAAGYDFDKVLAQFGLTPESIETQIKINGMDEVTRDLVDVNAKLQGIPPRTTTSVMIHSQEAHDKLESLGFKIHEWNQTTGEARVSANNDEALAKLDQVAGKVTELDMKSASPSIGVTDNASAAIAGVGGSLTGLSLTTAMPTLDANNLPALSKVGQTNSWINSVNGMLGVGTTDVNNQPAGAKVGQTGSWINSVNGMLGVGTTDANNAPAKDSVATTIDSIQSVNKARGEGKLEANNSQVKPSVDQAQGWINGLFGKVVTVTFRAVYEGFRDMLGGSDNNAGGAWDGARALPRFATGGHNGYRLPTSGPGTEITDGFIAFDRNHVPAARLDAGEWIINARSSEKYNRELAAINAGVFPKLPGYAEGGRSQRTAAEVLDFVWARNKHGQNGPLDGSPYNWAGINWGDCSAAMGSIARFMLGLAPFAARFATASADSVGPQWGMSRGKGHDGDFRVAYYNGGAGGGHMWGTLPDGTNVEMRGGRGGIIGKDAWGINHPSGRQFLHVPGVQYKLAGIEGAEGLMPPGASTTWSGTAGAAGAAGTTSPGLYKSPGNSGQIDNDQPRTWSDMAAGAVSALVGGQVEDALGVFGVPNQLPPIIQAWQMLNEKPGGGPSDWDLSTAAAEVKRLDAAIKVRERVTGEAAKALEVMNGGVIGNADQPAVRAAEAELDKQTLALEADRLAYERAQARLEELLGARAAAVAEKDLTSASSAAELSSALAPDVSFPDELQRELKIKYDPAGGAEQWRPMVIAALRKQGHEAAANDKAIVDKFIRQIDHESKGNPTITQQIKDVNSGGNEAEGLGQIAKSTWRQWRDPSLPDDWHDPWANINTMVRYVYGVPGKLDEIGRGRGYSSGGWIGGFGTKDSVPLVGAPGEFIVNRKAAAENRDVLEAMNAGRSVSGSGPQVTYNIHTFDLDEAMTVLARREAQRAQTFVGAR